MDIHYATSNHGKFTEAQLIFSRHSRLAIVHSPCELEEIQGSLREIARHKALQAYRQFQAPVIVDDGSLHFNALKGMPGPYIRPFLEAVGTAGLYDLIAHYPDKSCYAVCAIGYYAPGMKEPYIAEGVMQGTAVPPRGHGVFNPTSWNPIFQPEGLSQTCAELSNEQRASISHRYKALIQLLAFLQQEQSIPLATAPRAAPDNISPTTP